MVRFKVISHLHIEVALAIFLLLLLSAALRNQRGYPLFFLLKDRGFLPSLAEAPGSVQLSTFLALESAGSLFITEWGAAGDVIDSGSGLTVKEGGIKNCKRSDVTGPWRCERWERVVARFSK